ncbi:FKBP-type peptidyl-prolyl cis-trans isomerase [Pedobacter sp.]
MINKNLKYFFSILCLVVLFSCKKDTDGIKEIEAFIKKNNIEAVKDDSGLYYQIIKPGTGSAKITASSTITIKYEGKLLNGKVFDNGGGVERSFILRQLIQGWQIGVPKIQKGGEIRLLVPPSLGYGDTSAGDIPANSPLDFTIKLINVQ